EIRFLAAGDHGQTDWESISAFGLDVAQNSFAFEGVESFTHRKDHTVFCEVIGEPRPRFRTQIADQQIRITIHEADLQFHYPQACCCLARKHPATDDHDSPFYACHLPQSERVTDCAEIKDIAKNNDGDRRANGTAASR